MSDREKQLNLNRARSAGRRWMRRPRNSAKKDENINLKPLNTSHRT